VVALVGYTNAGKSTLFNRLTGAEVMAKDMLFATLDPTMRAVALPTGLKVILSDTVGFISDLPTQLVAAFRATLEEVLEADLILHVRDIAHPETEDQAADVRAILGELGVAGDTPVIEVWNKTDLLDPARRAALEAVAGRKDDVLTLSARTGEGMAALLEATAAALDETRTRRALHLDFAEGRKRAWLYDQGIVEEEREEDGGYALTVNWTARQEQRFRRL
jgi:GTP-binding protein HflX